MRRGLWMVWLGVVGCGPAVTLDGISQASSTSTGAPNVPIDPDSSGPSIPASTGGPIEPASSSSSTDTTGSTGGSSTTSGSSSTTEPGLPGTWSTLFPEEIYSLEAGPGGLYIVSRDPNNPDFGGLQLRRLNEDGVPDLSFGDGGFLDPGPWDADRETGDIVVVSSSAVRRYDESGQQLWVTTIDGIESPGPVASVDGIVYMMARAGAVAEVRAFDAFTGQPVPGFFAPDLVGPLGVSPTTAQLVAHGGRVFAGITPDDVASELLFRFSELDGVTGDIVQSGVTAAVSTRIEALFVTDDVAHWVGTLPPHNDPSWSPLFVDDPTTHEPMQLISSVVATDEAVFFGGWTNSKDWRVERRDPITLELDPGFGVGGVIQHDESHDTRVLDVDVYGDWLYFVYRALGSEKGWVVERRQQLDGAL